jgi:hypothetical protein
MAIAAQTGTTPRRILAPGSITCSRPRSQHPGQEQARFTVHGYRCY